MKSGTRDEVGGREAREGDEPHVMLRAAKHLADRMGGAWEILRFVQDDKGGRESGGMHKATPRSLGGRSRARLKVCPYTSAGWASGVPILSSLPGVLHGRSAP